MCCGLKSASIRCLLPHLFWLIASVGPDQRGSQKSTSGKAELCYAMSMFKKQTCYETLLSSLPLTLSHFARKIRHNVKSDEKKPDRPQSCLLCATSAFFGKRLGTAGTSDLGSLGCFGNVWSSLVFFFFFPQTFSFAVNSTTEFPELFSGSSLMSITTSFPTTDFFLSSLVPSCYLLWVTLLHGDRGGGRERREGCVCAYLS